RLHGRCARADHGRRGGLSDVVENPFRCHPWRRVLPACIRGLSYAVCVVAGSSMRGMDTGMSAASAKTRLPGWLRAAPDSMVMRIRRAGQRPRLQALNLLWSGWAFAAPLFMSVEPGFYWSLLASYPVFLLLFALAYLRPRAQMGYYSVALVLLGCACMPFNPTAWAYGVFGCVF